MIPWGASLDATLCPGCGTRCQECGERMCSTNGPAPAPSCADHPVCQPCATHPVWCRECGEVLRQVAEDRAEQTAYDVVREAGA